MNDNFKPLMIGIFIFIFGMIAIALLIKDYNKISVGSCVVDGAYDTFKIVEVGKLGGYRVLDPITCRIKTLHSLYGGLALTDCFDQFDKCGDKNE